MEEMTQDQLELYSQITFIRTTLEVCMALVCQSSNPSAPLAQMEDLKSQMDRILEKTYSRRASEAELQRMTEELHRLNEEFFQAVRHRMTGE